MKLDIYAQPGAKKSGFAGNHGGRLKIKTAARPSDGQANEEIIRFMAQTLNIPKTKIKIISGLSSRFKTLEIDADIAEKDINVLLLDIKR